MKKLLLKICYIRSAKVASDKCSVKKVFLMVVRAAKVTCFYIDQHLSGKKCSRLNELFFS